jgi:peroxiredoxin Q/BCP
MTIQQDGKLPDLTLTGVDNQPIKLTDYIGKPLVLYFYPKDDTSGCTREAQDFSQHLPEFEKLGATVLGVSKDSPIKHQKFIDKYDLTISLATDDDSGIMEAFGVWVQKSMYGKTYMGIDRSTFLFDANGKLARSWRKVRVPGHAVEVLETLRTLA